METLSRESTEFMVQQRHVQCYRLGQEGLDSQEREELLYKLANTCRAMIPEKQGVVVDVARLIGGSLAEPLITYSDYLQTSKASEQWTS